MLARGLYLQVLLHARAGGRQAPGFGVWGGQLQISVAQIILVKQGFPTSPLNGGVATLARRFFLLLFFGGGPKENGCGSK